MDRKILVLEDDLYRIDTFTRLYPEVVITTEAKDCIKKLKEMKSIDILFLDHDLGGKIYVNESLENTGSGVVRWIVKNKPEIDQIIIHSYNISASVSMYYKLLDAGYVKTTMIPFRPDWGEI
jgi:CheY-like chemotaxis protein